MRIFKLPIIAFAAAVLMSCSIGGANDEPVTAAPAAAPAPVATTATAPAKGADTGTPSPSPSPVSARPDNTIQTTGAHIDASAFLNALVESGCQIDKAEYKEVKRGGAIKVTCSKTIDALKVELDDL